MQWVATADAAGACDCSSRAGPAGFVQVLDARTLRYPEYRGNGVLASSGNIIENPHVGLFFVDFTDALIGLHVNGGARIVERPATAASRNGGSPRAEHWVEVAVEKAYIHCRKHIPRMVPAPRRRRSWGHRRRAGQGRRRLRRRQPRRDGYHTRRATVLNVTCPL